MEVRIPLSELKRLMITGSQLGHQQLLSSFGSMHYTFHHSRVKLPGQWQLDKQRFMTQACSVFSNSVSLSSSTG